MGIGVPHQNSIVRGHLYEFHSKAAITDIIFHNYKSRDSSDSCCKLLIVKYKLDNL